MLFGVKILLQGLLNSNSHRDSHADHGRAMRSIADRDLATCRWQVATIPMGATEVTNSYFRDSSTATATETVMPTMGLLPAPRKPIISTWAGTEEEPANCASPCIRPMVSVRP